MRSSFRCGADVSRRPRLSVRTAADKLPAPYAFVGPVLWTRMYPYRGLAPSGGASPENQGEAEHRRERYADDEREAGYQLDWRELWPYTAATFRTTRAGYDVEMYIEPGYEIVRLRLRTASDGAELLDLDLRAVQGVGVERIHDRELLRVDFPDGSPASTLWLRMKPDVALHWSYGAAR